MPVPTQTGVFAANTPFTVYQVAAGNQGSVSVNIVARLACTASVYISPDDTVSEAKMIERNLVLAENDKLLLEPITLPAGWRIRVQASVANSLAVNVWGVEGAA